MPNDMNLDEMKNNQAQEGGVNESQESIESRDDQRENEDASSEGLVEGVKLLYQTSLEVKIRINKLLKNLVCLTTQWHKVLLKI